MPDLFHSVFSRKQDFKCTLTQQNCKLLENPLTLAGEAYYESYEHWLAMRTIQRTACGPYWAHGTLPSGPSPGGDAEQLLKQ